jgi:hypothetical protein
VSVAALALTAGLTACGSAAATSSPSSTGATNEARASDNAVSGTVALDNTNWSDTNPNTKPGDPCTGNNQHQLTVTNQSGSILGETTLGSGTVQNIDESGSGGTADHPTCVVSFTVTTSGSASQYGFSVDGTKPYFVSKQDLTANPLELTWSGS